MNIYFLDDYSEHIYTATDRECPIIPDAGDAVNFGIEDWVVKHRIFHFPASYVVVHLTQEHSKPAKVKEEISRQGDLQRSIIEITKKQNDTDKAVRRVTEQAASIRKHINQQIIKERKE